MKEENLYTPDCIRTNSGIYMNVFEPTLDMICIEDVAHALSNQPRFGGHLPEFYSVAQHSYLCSALASDKNKLAALLHDSSEAFLMDFPSPIKQRMLDYKGIEDRLMLLIAKKFGFKYPLNDEVKKIDKDMLEMEWNELMLQKKSVDNFICFSPAKAKEMFLGAYYSLIN
ncbi:MAG TPA: hypothetical protein VNY73_00965 [Bacteroidia bacterium]|jgi:hypothetical protein|nr:hypothetical protein [Bacteroidia bacterium]